MIGGLDLVLNVVGLVFSNETMQTHLLKLFQFFKDLFKYSRIIRLSNVAFPHGIRLVDGIIYVADEGCLVGLCENAVVEFQTMIVLAWGVS